MSILSKIYKLREEYVVRHDAEPEILFLNFSTWEEVLRDPQSVNGVPEEIAGCEMYPANNMQEYFLFCDHSDMAKALEKYDGTDSPVIIKKLTVVDRPEAQGGRRVVKDRSLLNFKIPSEAINSYQRYQKSKNVRF